jgi:hypothetical protein
VYIGVCVCMCVCVCVCARARACVCLCVALINEKYRRDKTSLEPACVESGFSFLV